MSLGEVVREKLAEWRPAGEGRQTLPVADAPSGWTAAITVERQESVGCQAWEVALRHARAARPASLRGWADDIAQRVTGLLEPLAVVEVDAPRNEALLRSNQPSGRGDDVYYYEVHLKGTTEASLRRYHASHQPKARREQVPFALTHEVLAKVVGDLAGS
jgi:hypothetical protein